MAKSVFLENFAGHYTDHACQLKVGVIAGQMNDLLRLAPF